MNQPTPSVQHLPTPLCIQDLLNLQPDMNASDESQSEALLFKNLDPFDLNKLDRCAHELNDDDAELSDKLDVEVNSGGSLVTRRCCCRIVRIQSATLDISNYMDLQSKLLLQLFDPAAAAKAKVAASHANDLAKLSDTTVDQGVEDPSQYDPLALFR